MSRSRPTSRAPRGYTMVEVMMGLSILAIGAAGIVSLQRFAVMGTMTSRHVTSATNVTAGTIETMSLESGRWANNSSGGTGSLTPLNMPWLGPALAAPNVWFAPNAHGFRVDGTAVDASVAADTDQVAYCTHVRAVFLGNVSVVGALDAADSARVEVRTFYAKSGRTIAAECRTWTGADVTNLFDNNALAAAGVARTRDEYGVVFMTTVIRRNGT